MKKQTVEELLCYPWEAVLTVRTNKYGTDEQAAYEHIQAEVIRPLMRYYKNKIAAIGTHNRLENPHAHILMLGEDRVLRNPNNLKLYNLLYTPKNKIVRGFDDAYFEPYRDVGGITYVYDNLPKRSGRGGWLFFNRDYLEHVKQEVRHAA